MRNRTLWILLLSLALVAVCGAILMTTWGGLTWARERGLRWQVSSDQVSVESTEELRYAVTGPATLDLTNHVGDVKVTTGAADAIVVTIRRRAWGADQAEAQARLDALTVDAAQTGSTLTLSVPNQPAEVVNIIGEHRADSIEFSVVVPAETSVTAHTRFGAVSVAGTTGAADVRTGAGALTLTGLIGPIVARSDFGEVTVEDAAGPTLEARSGSGALRLRRVTTTGPVSLNASFGDVAYEGGSAGALTVEAGSGRVSLTNLDVEGEVSVDNNFGAVVLQGVTAGSYDLHSGSGEVSLDGAAGAITADSDFGDVTVSNARSATVNLTTGSGTVTFSGDLGAGPHELRSDFGSVVLSLPAGAALDVDLSTDFGNIRSAFPLTLRGAPDEDHWQGQINGGGPSLTVHTNSGSISLEQLP